MSESAFPWKPSRSTQRFTIRLWPLRWPRESDSPGCQAPGGGTTAYSGHPNPGARQSGHSPAPFITIEGDDGKDYEAERKPPITVNNVVSACGKDYMRKSYPGGRRHAFWGRMECGLVLSSVSPWEMVQKEKGCDTWRLLLQMVQGFLEGKDGELPLSPNHLGQCGPSDGLG